MRHQSLTNQLRALPAEKTKNIKNLLHSQQPVPTLMRSNLDALWEEFYDLADKNFISEFARKPNDRAWEMQLGVALRKAGFELHARKPGPDLLTYDGENKIWIEAVVAKAGKSADAVPNSTLTEEEIVLRITSALSRKIEQLEEHIAAGIIEHSDRYVIALCTSIPNHLVNSYHAIRAVYGIGGWEFDRDRETGEIISGRFACKREVRNANNAPVFTDAFLNPTCGCGRVSGLLFADGPCALDLSQLGDRFATLHNFIAQFPLKTGRLRFHSEYRLEEKEGVLHLQRSYGKARSRLPFL